MIDIHNSEYPVGSDPADCFSPLTAGKSVVEPLLQNTSQIVVLVILCIHYSESSLGLLLFSLLELLVSCGVLLHSQSAPEACSNCFPWSACCTNKEFLHL